MQLSNGPLEQGLSCIGTHMTHLGPHLNAYMHRQNMFLTTFTYAQADLPGLKKEDIKVNVDGDVLTVRCKWSFLV